MHLTTIISDIFGIKVVGLVQALLRREKHLRALRSGLKHTASGDLRKFCRLCRLLQNGVLVKVVIAVGGS